MCTLKEKRSVMAVSIETIWTYTGFAVLTALAWALVAFMVWLGAQVLWAVWRKYGRYKEVLQLLDFLDEDEECDEKFKEWLAKRNYMSRETIPVWRKLRRMMRWRGSAK